MRNWEKKMGVVNCVWCVKKKRKKKWKERKIQSKECVCCGKNRSIDENEGKMGQKDDICLYFWICSTSFIDSLWNPWSFLVEPTYLQPHYNPFERSHDSLIVCDLSSGDRVDKQAYGRRCFHKNLSVNTNL